MRSGDAHRPGSLKEAKRLLDLQGYYSVTLSGWIARMLVIYSGRKRKRPPEVARELLAEVRLKKLRLR